MRMNCRIMYTCSDVWRTGLPAEIMSIVHVLAILAIILMDILLRWAPPVNTSPGWTTPRWAP